MKVEKGGVDCKKYKGCYKWEGQGSIRHDELTDMGCLVPMRKLA